MDHVPALSGLDLFGCWSRRRPRSLDDGGFHDGGSRLGLSNGSGAAQNGLRLVDGDSFFGLRATQERARRFGGGLIRELGRIYFVRRRRRLAHALLVHRFVRDLACLLGLLRFLALLAHDSPYGTPGVGLGLHIVRNLVDSMGGSLVAQRNSGKGSTFTVRLPSGL